ncbi:signal transduction histidine kinase/CheY-like chemotaxis protein [Pseudomonas sp. SORGH_AS199]|uniref:hybrid sensor histidine kinase/response regulator n=1 Tax=Pseudomonas sp. SORGH_AS_0199 TaxID=3041761 RepID=UPI002857DC89|nr:ATP-binding protein [Pseudomonas sp. SORGH_AS_0199]MDR6228985.1 signal transduction histidine kinase/CheY-like chemotaxis protein [Pseudomonas sp. SORGH_AS_0199]
MSYLESFAWETTPLGARASWPVALRTTYDLLMASPFAMCATWGAEQTLIYNQAYAPFLGARHPAALGQPIDKVWAELWDEIAPLIERTLSGEALHFVDKHFVMTRNGYPEDTYWSFSYSPLRDGEAIVGMLNITTETTAGVQAHHQRDVAEAALRRHNLTLEQELSARIDERDSARAAESSVLAAAERVQLALAAGAIIGTWYWDLPTDRFTVDEAFAINFGLDPALGRDGLSLAQVVATVHPDDQAGLAAAIADVIARGGRYAYQYRVRRSDGRYYWLEANGHVELAPDGTPLRFPGVLLDVDARRALADERDRALAELRDLTATLEQRVEERTEELRRSEEALRQSQKMEAVGQLTGGLAHDFNNLLAGISGSLDLMSLRIGQGRFTELEKYLLAAQGSAKRAAALTHRLLAFARRQTLAPEATVVNQLVGGMLDLVQRTVGPAIQVHFTSLPDDQPLLVDQSQLENALLNLCINARDAMPNGGRILIAASHRTLGEGDSRDFELAPGRYLHLSVTDTGSGMPPEVAAKAFEPFFTTKPMGQGTGLGLSMIYGFARQSGGQLRLRSMPGEGTTVCLYLPLRPVGRPCGSPLAAGQPDLLEGAHATVLVVDDEPTVRMLVTDLLRELGYVIIEAADGAGGLEVLHSDARIDLLVTDVGLPGGMNGRQLADAARVQRPALKVLFITGFAETSLLSDGHLEPGMAILTKPFAVEALAQRVRSLVAG